MLEINSCVFLEAGEQGGCTFFVVLKVVVLISRASLERDWNFGVAAVAQLVERVLGKDEVMGPSPISSSFFWRSVA